VKALALKEWAVVVKALENNQQSVLFRKGGLLDPQSGFDVEARWCLLFPTFYHQQRIGVRTEYVPMVDEVFTNQPTTSEIVITSCLEILSFDQVTTLGDLKTWDGKHIYKDDVLQQRWEATYAPVLWALQVRTLVLPKPLHIPMNPTYTGCKSWVHLEISDSELAQLPSEFREFEAQK
jgi:hypothetical protein